MTFEHILKLINGVYKQVKEDEKRCVVETDSGSIQGTIIREYEEIGGPDDGGQFAVIKLDNGQFITVLKKEIQD